jgi:HSP20 family protein
MVKIVRWNPNVQPRNLRTMDRFFDDMWRNAYGDRDRFESDTARPVLRPAMDVVENDDTLTIRMDLPGLSPDDVNIEIDDDVLTISAEREAPAEDEQERYYHRERVYGAFKRSLRLPDTLDADGAEATFNNGVLSLVLPKRPETQPRKIKVETA